MVMFDADAFLKATVEEPKKAPVKTISAKPEDDPAWRFINETHPTDTISRDYWIDKAAEVRGNRPSEVTDAQRFYNQTLRQYGITYEQYSVMLALQGGLCAICHGDEIVKRGGKPVRLSIDHNHHTGKVRGLLCTCCNSMLGFAQEDISTLRNAIDYLAKDQDE